MATSGPVVITLEKNVSLRPFTTLKAGGSAELFAHARSLDELADVSVWAHQSATKITILGFGSNVLPSDAGVPGVVVLNEANRIEVYEGGLLQAECGCGFQDLFFRTAQHGLRGLEFAVGIPGTLGGALVSNAGAYRSCVSEFLTELEVVYMGKRQWVPPSFMEFSYRDSILRRQNAQACTLLRVRMKLPTGRPKAIYDEARDYQRQRISKQPPQASAGSFFKNVNDKILAEDLDKLAPALRAAGVVPAGFLIERAGLQGLRVGGAMFARRHANFIVNIGNAAASDIRRLAMHAKKRVWEQFKVRIEEEVLYLGAWSAFEKEFGSA